MIVKLCFGQRIGCVQNRLLSSVFTDSMSVLCKKSSSQYYKLFTDFRLLRCYDAYNLFKFFKMMKCCLFSLLLLSMQTSMLSMLEMSGMTSMACTDHSDCTVLGHRYGCLLYRCADYTDTSMLSCTEQEDCCQEEGAHCQDDFYTCVR